MSVGEVPVGCVFVRPHSIEPMNGNPAAQQQNHSEQPATARMESEDEVVAAGHNETNMTRNVSP